MTEAEFWAQLNLVLPGAKVVRHEKPARWQLIDGMNREVCIVDVESLATAYIVAYRGFDIEERLRDGIFERLLFFARKHAGIKPEPAPQTWWQKVKSWVRGEPS